MTLSRSIRAIASASGDDIVDWDATIEAAVSGTEPGSLNIPGDEREGYITAVQEAAAAVETKTGIEFCAPDSITLLNRHHWIETNVATVRNLLSSLDTQQSRFPGVVCRANTATMATTLSIFARRVQGQFNPFATDEPGSMYVIRPNVIESARKLGIEYKALRDWIIVHEMVHVAEFTAARWLADYIESLIREAIDNITSGNFDRSMPTEFNAAMTAIEGYAESIGTRTIQHDEMGVEAAIQAHRHQRGLLGAIIQYLFGLRQKRRQYERGKAFFDYIIEARGIQTAAVVWDERKLLPTDRELDDPQKWLDRVDP